MFSLKTFDYLCSRFSRIGACEGSDSDTRIAMIIIIHHAGTAANNNAY